MAGAMAKQITLGQFVKWLAASLDKKGVELPLKNERAWHQLFYSLKNSSKKGRPKFLERLVFDWDGAYPKSQELSAFLHGLHRTASGQADNPGFGRIRVVPALAERWHKEAEMSPLIARKFLDDAVAMAEREFAAAT